MFKIYFSIGTPVEHGVLNPLLTAEKLKKIDALHDVYDLLMPTNYVKNQRIRRMGYKQFVKEQEEYKAALEETITVDSADWFGNNNNAEIGHLRQIDFAMMNYGSVLTVLWRLDPSGGETS